MSDEEIEQLARETMTAFWRTNNLEQKFGVLRQALRKAALSGSVPDIEREAARFAAEGAGPDA